MTREERKRVLEWIDQGQISVEEGIARLRNLGSEEAWAEETPGEAAAGWGSTGEAPELDEVRGRARHWASILLWAGVGVVILSAIGMFWRLQSSGLGFGFCCLMVPFLLGVGWIALVASQHGRWVFVDVQQTTGEWPRRITFGLPVPLGWVAWLLRLLGRYVDGMEQAQTLARWLPEAVSAEAPLVVNVEDEDAIVRLYIG